MTSRVTINSHAGWPILVTGIRGEALATKHVESWVVPPYTERDFYIHSGFRIIAIEELPYGQTS